MVTTHKRMLFALVMALTSIFASAAPPTSFNQAKILLKNHVYYDRNTVGEAYCGCTWEWRGQSGGVINPSSCGLDTSYQPTRAMRTEIEHLTPAENFGRQMECWRNGGRKNCNANDPEFNRMEADLHNLTPVVGSINAARSNYRFNPLQSSSISFGKCDFKVDTKLRFAEPPNTAKGLAARANLYMAHQYGMSLSSQQQKLLTAWDKMYPPTPWEYERDKRIAKIMGWHNPYVVAHLGVKPSKRLSNNASKAVNTSVSAPSSAAIIGNRNSKIYHLPVGCPSYNAVSPRNQVSFNTEAQALASGYRKAKNCN